MGKAKCEPSIAVHGWMDARPQMMKCSMLESIMYTALAIVRTDNLFGIGVHKILEGYAQNLVV